ncbi:MAG TPA: helix-turn-helix transcriptional regulator [Bryobacteraceae bacterium]|nr:helix-turn-helix transcriptional regulator [Bryobacteraceae bacterium]
METLDEYRTLPFVDPKEAGRNLERLLRERGMSQKELVERTKIEQPAISRAIRTGKGMSLRRWQTIASTLEIPVEYIFGLQRLPDKKKIA